ncbi:hypothetical protein [Desulfofalx alkaliphila]|uniref:hypothetical protein n=1 Tax=Desulfofalx alkaliphila TaxID=105483 RepID=UPI0004E1A68E|nr:hypothetical protein [Desulfofalx alkaliphila]
MNGRRLIYLTVSLLAVVFLLGFAYLVTVKLFSPINQGLAMNVSANGADLVVSDDTVLRIKNIYTCNDEEDLGEEAAVTGLKGMTYEDLQQIFSPEDGWQVTFDSPNELVLGRMIGELCARHQQYRHLGVYQEKLAVFQGPLGVDAVMLQVLQRPVKDLPPAMREQLEQAKNFTDLPLQTKELLKKELEFENEKKLNAVLENLDELH